MGTPIRNTEVAWKASDGPNKCLWFVMFDEDKLAAVRAVEGVRHVLDTNDAPYRYWVTIDPRYQAPSVLEAIRAVCEQIPCCDDGLCRD